MGTIERGAWNDAGLLPRRRPSDANAAKHPGQDPFARRHHAACRTSPGSLHPGGHIGHLGAGAVDVYPGRPAVSMVVGLSAGHGALISN